MILRLAGAVLLVAIFRPTVLRAGDASLAARLDAILDSPGKQKAVFGGCVVDLASGDVLYARNAQQPLIPASNMKMVVMAAAIERLGHDFEFRTSLARRGDDLVVIGGGDPTIGDARLCKAAGQSPDAVFGDWAAHLKAAGVSRIAGKLVINDAVFDQTFVHPAWPADQFQEWYEAPVGGLNYNDNCVDVTLSPSAPGKPAQIAMLPAASCFKLVNQTSCGKKHGPWAKRSRDGTTLTVSGPVARWARLGPIAVRDPGLFFGDVMKASLASRGIRIEGPVVRERVPLDPDRLPAGYRLIAIHKSPLSTALSRAGKQSLNMMAECVFKLLGRGSWRGGQEAVGEFLRTIGVPADQFQLDDGGGLSRGNRLSAEAATSVLRYMHQAPPVRAGAFKNALSRSGMDGTLEKRLRGPETRGRIYGKTGYINGVRTLSGYVHTRSGRWLAFAFFYNQARATRPLTAAQDRACELLVSEGFTDKKGQSASSVRPSLRRSD